jgi:HEAT repeat protein
MHISNTGVLQRRTAGRPRASRVFTTLLLLVSTTAGTAASITAQDARRNSRPAQTTAASEAAAKLLREGRDLLEGERWDQAAATFARLLEEYPRDANAAAALYWLAFTSKMQRKYSEAGQQLERLINQFPQSSWVEDARLMQLELANQLGNQRVLEDAMQGSDSTRRLVALQSLLQTDPESALAHASGLLKQESESSTAFKESIVSLLGRSGGRQATDFLIEVARAQGDAKLRRAAVLALGQPGNEGALNFLGELLAPGEDGELKEAAVFAVSRIEGERARALLLQAARTSNSAGVRASAVNALSRFKSDLVIDDLTEIYKAESDAEVRKNIIHALSRVNSPRAQARLLELARTSDDLELRKQAIFWLGRQGDAEQGADGIIQLYDTEQNDEAKQLLLYKLARMKSKKALHKLMDIAQRDASTEMRKRAVFWLNRSADPEALKFLRELKE